MPSVICQITESPSTAGSTQPVRTARVQLHHAGKGLPGVDRIQQDALRPGQLLVQRVELGPRPAGLGLFKVGFALGGPLLGFELAAEGFSLFRLAEGLL